MTTRAKMIRRVAAAAAVLAAFAPFAPAALAQSGASDARLGEQRGGEGWTAWLGCWEPVGARPLGSEPAPPAPIVCVVPAEGASAVEIATIQNGDVVERTRIFATGQPRASAREGCTGTERAEWSADGRRVYLRSEYDCAGGVTRRSTAVMSMSASGEWLDVQGVAAGEYAGVHAMRYRAVTDASSTPSIPAEFADILRGRALAVNTARLAAAAPLGVADVIEASRHLDAPVMEAWLVEREQRFALDASRLVELADARVPSGVIDLMVALSYPEVFTLDRAARAGELRPAEAARSSGGAIASSGGAMQTATWDWIPYGYRGYYGGYGWDAYGLNAYSPYYGYGPYSYGWYSGGRPVVVVIREPGSGGDGSVPQRGRLVNGRGYTRSGGSGGSASTSPRGRASGSSSGSQSGAASGQTSSGSSSAGSSGSSSGSTRTAKPRSPNP